MKTTAISLLVLVLLSGPACTTTVTVSVTQPSRNNALTGTSCKLQRELRNQPQQTDFWCWAASAQTVIDYVKNEYGESQWELVEAVVRTQLEDTWAEAKRRNPSGTYLPRPTCGMAMLPVSQTAPPQIEIARNICWTNGWPEEVFYTDAYRMQFEGYEYDWADAGLSWNEIVTEICEDRPMISAIHYSLELGGGSHTVVIGGYNELEDGSQWVHVYDPGANTLEDDYYLWPYEIYLGDPGVFTHVRDYKNISLP